MATHSSVLAWRIPGTGEPGGLPSMGSHRVGHDWRDLAAAAAAYEVAESQTELSNPHFCTFTQILVGSGKMRLCRLARLLPGLLTSYSSGSASLYLGGGLRAAISAVCRGQNPCLGKIYVISNIIQFRVQTAYVTIPNYFLNLLTLQLSILTLF